MSKKKNIRIEDITEKDILSLYEGILPLLNNNPENLDVAHQLNKLLIRFIWYDFFHYTMTEVNKSPGNEHFTMFKSQWTDKNESKTKYEIVASEEQDPDAIFDASIEHNYQNTIKRMKESVPDKPDYHYHRLISRVPQKVMVGFFKFKDKKEDNSFSENDLRIFKKLSPHILLLFGTILNPIFKTKSFQYFDAYSHICADVSNNFNLSESETKLLPEILFGYSNEEIAERNFVSLATVKKHIQHIFKKTGVKNRMDFIGKFFTSPERVEL